jgi:hypothetical protein
LKKNVILQPENGSVAQLDRAIPRTRDGSHVILNFGSVAQLDRAIPRTRDGSHVILNFGSVAQLDRATAF